MHDRWTSTTPTSITVRKPKFAVSPRVQTPEPLPIDWRRGARSLRLLVGAAICAVIGHNWRFVWNRRWAWVPEARSHVLIQTTVKRRRTCARCEQEQSRIVGGKWRKSA
jgi:hypothetical protein